MQVDTLLMELIGLSDGKMVSALIFDVRFQYALHTTSYLKQPLNDRTLGCFRRRFLAYEEEVGIDLIYDTFRRFTEGLSEIVTVGLPLERMVCMVGASNIKRMGRLELLYTCVSDLAKKQKIRDGITGYPSSLHAGR